MLKGNPTRQTFQRGKILAWTQMSSIQNWIIVLCLLLGLYQSSATFLFHDALINDNLPPSSSKCLSSTNVTTTFNFTWYDKPQNFSAVNAPYERNLFLLEMSNDLVQNNTQEPKGWTMRISRGGNVYSFMGPWGQAVAPQVLPKSPFMDEVWQDVAVSNNLNTGTNKYFIHQAGSYFDPTLTPMLAKPWFSPPTGSFCSGHSCSIVAWSQHAHLPTAYNSSRLSFNRYTNCGDGVYEHVFGIHNMATDPKVGPKSDTLDYFNTLWMGFRTSAFRDIVRSYSTSDTMRDIDPIPDFGNVGLISVAETAGYTIFAEFVRSPSLLYTLPCGHVSGTGSSSVPCSSNTSVPLTLKLVAGPMSDPGPCILEYSLTESIIVSCRLNTTADINSGTVSTTPQNLILVNTRTNAYMYLHPTEGVTSWSRNSSGANWLIFSPADNSTTAADINTKFPAGTLLQVQYEPTYKLPCGDGTGAIVDCSNSSSIGPPRISIISNSPGNYCDQMTDLTATYGKIVARCRITPTVAINSGDPNTQLTFMSNNTSPTLVYRAFGVLYWSYKDLSTNYTYIYLFTGDGGVLFLRNYFLPGRTFTVSFQNEGKPFEQNMALSNIHGSSSSLKESIGGTVPGTMNVYAYTDIRYGIAGNPSRDYTPYTLRTMTALTEGSTYVKRHFMIADRLDRMQNRSLAWVNETYQAAVTQSNVTAGRAIKLVRTSNSAFGGALATETCTNEYTKAPFVCYGSSRPQNGYYAHFAITCGTQYYIGSDRYYFSPKFSNLTKQPWACNNSTESPTWTFLGFYQSGVCTSLMGLTFDSSGCGDKKPTAKPSKKPTKKPTKKPSKAPTKMPSIVPSTMPTKMPSANPSKKPSRKRSKMLSKKPSKKPSNTPSKRPTANPSKTASKKPSTISPMKLSKPSKKPSRKSITEPSQVKPLQPRVAALKPSQSITAPTEPLKPKMVPVKPLRPAAPTLKPLQPMAASAKPLQPKVAPLKPIQQPKMSPLKPIQQPKMSPLKPTQQPKMSPLKPIQQPKMSPLKPIQQPKMSPLKPIQQPKVAPLKPTQASVAAPMKKLQPMVVPLKPLQNSLAPLKAAQPATAPMKANQFAVILLKPVRPALPLAPLKPIQPMVAQVKTCPSIGCI